MRGLPVNAETGRRRLWANLALLGALSLVWGLNWPAMKVVLGAVPVLTFRALCLWITGPVLIAIACFGGERFGLPAREWPRLFAVSFFNVTMWYLGTATGLSIIPAGRAALLAFTMPLWVALLSAFVLGERLGPRRILGLLLGMAGIAVLLAPAAATLTAVPLGAAAVLAAAIGWSIGTVGMKRLRFSRGVAQVTGWQLFIGGAPIAIGAMLHDPPFHPLALPPATLAVLCYIILLPMIFGQWAWFKALDRMSGTIAAIGSLAVPVVGLLSSAILLREPLGLWEAVAMMLLLFGLSLVLFEPRPRDRTGALLAGQPVRR